MTKNTLSLVYKIDTLPLVAKQLIDFIGDNKIWLFYGEMGMGKTTLIRSICQVLGVCDNVSSPTFSFVNEYVLPQQSIYHFDFYRLKNEYEAYDLGYEEYFYSDNYCFVEWPSKISQLLLDKTFVRIFIEMGSNMFERNLNLMIES